MSNDRENLTLGVIKALQSKTPSKISVHSDTQAELGQIAAGRMAAKYGAKAEDLTFVVIPEEEWNKYPVGATVVP